MKEDQKPHTDEAGDRLSEVLGRRPEDNTRIPGEYRVEDVQAAREKARQAAQEAISRNRADNGLAHHETQPPSDNLRPSGHDMEAHWGMARARPPARPMNPAPIVMAEERPLRASKPLMTAKTIGILVYFAAGSAAGLMLLCKMFFEPMFARLSAARREYYAHARKLITDLTLVLSGRQRRDPTEYSASSKAIIERTQQLRQRVRDIQALTDDTRALEFEQVAGHLGKSVRSIPRTQDQGTYGLSQTQRDDPVTGLRREIRNFKGSLLNM